MEHRNKDKITEETEGGEKQSPQQIRYPILPKNIMGIVGNTPVVLGQQYILVKTVADSPIVSTGSIIKLNASTNSPTDPKHVKGNTNSIVGDTGNYCVATKPISLPLDTSRVIKTLVGPKIMKTSHTGSTDAVHALVTGRSNEASLSQSQSLESAPAFQKIRSLLLNDKLQSLSQSNLLKDKPFVPVSGNSKSTSSQSRSSSDQLVLISKPDKTKAVVDLNMCPVTSNQRKVASCKQQGVPIIVNLPESSGNQGSAKVTQIDDVHTKYLKVAQLSQHHQNIRTLQQGNAVAYQAHSPVYRERNIVKLVAPPKSTIIAGSGQSMVIGSIASLSHHTQSHLPPAPVQKARKTFSAGIEKKIPLARPSRSLLSFPTPYLDTSEKKFSQQACPALKSILSSSVSSNPSMLGYSVPATGFLSSSSRMSSDGGKATPLNNTIEIDDEDSDSEMTQCSTNIIDYYTSLENSEKDQQVMVMRPVFESDVECNENSVVTFQTKGHDRKGNQILSSVNGNRNHSLTSASQGSERLHETEEDDKQCTDTPLNLKIQSVFSLADALPESESSNYDVNTNNAFETEICHMSGSDSEDVKSDVQDEEETTFNLHENEWKKACPLSFVVLERLTPQDIEDKRVGRTKLSVRCSHHCRMRTLSYMCNLNLLNCENQTHFEDATGNEKTNVYTILSNDDREIKETDSEISSSTVKKHAEVTASSSCLKKDGNDKQNYQCKQPAQLCQDDKQNETTELKIQSCYTLKGETGSHCQHTPIASNIESKLQPEASSVSKPKVSSLTSEKQEWEGLEEDLISLKRRIEEKRLKMKLQKTQRQLSSMKKVDKVKKAAPLSPTALLKKTIAKLPGRSLSLKKSQQTNSSQKNPKKVGKLKANSSSSAPTTKAYRSLKELPDTRSSRVIPAYYVMDCSASSLFNNFKSSAASMSTGKNLLTTSPLPLKNTQPPTSPPGNVKTPLKTVYSTLKSLADHFKAIGHVPTSNQYVMAKINNSPLVLKVTPADLLPENLDTLKKAAHVTDSQLKEQQRNVSQPSEAIPHVSLASASKPNSTQQTKQQQRPSSPIYLSYAEAKAHKQKSPSSRPKTSSASQKLSINTKSLTSTSSHKSCSSSPNTTASSARSILSEKNKQSSNVSLSVSVASTIVNSSENKTSSTSSRSSHSLLRTNLNRPTCKNINNLTHFPITSSLLPERQLKRPTSSPSEEERAAKRRKLEEKYPLPPGVIIKCEPDTSEYELDSNWSVTSDIQTDYLSSSEIANIETGDYPTTMKSASESSCMISDENQHNQSSGTANAEENVDYANSPPHLDSIHSCLMDEPSGMSTSPIEIENDEEPPVLEPMPSTSFKQITSRENKAITLSSAQVYDSGYDSVGPSSSTESLGSQQTLNKQPLTKMSKIQELKELLKMKQLQVEHMLKKRSEIPEVDLNAL